MIKKDIDEMMSRHVDLLVNIPEGEGSLLQIDELGSPRTPSPRPVAWGSPRMDEISDYYGESDYIYD